MGLDRNDRSQTMTMTVFETRINKKAEKKFEVWNAATSTMVASFKFRRYAESEARHRNNEIFVGPINAKTVFAQAWNTQGEW
jgi:hypothetical protein